MYVKKGTGFGVSVRLHTKGDMFCWLPHPEDLDQTSYKDVLLITWTRAEDDALQTLVICRSHARDLLETINQAINHFSRPQPGGEHGPR